MVMAPGLRALAKSYAGGQIEKAKYRSDRTLFIEAVMSGAVSIQDQSDGQRATLSTQSRVKSASDKTMLVGNGLPAHNAVSRNKPAPDTPPVKKTAPVIGIGIAAAIAVLAAIVVFMTGDQPAQQAAPVTGLPAVNDTDAAQAPALASTAAGLVRTFLETNNWSRASIDNFLTEWNGLADSEKSALTGGIEMAQLTNAIYKKLLEERALSGIGNPETSYEKQRELVDFANQAGINDSRIVLPEPPPR